MPRHPSPTGRSAADPPSAGGRPAVASARAERVGAHPDLLERIGPHTTGVGCLYLKDLANVDVEVLEELVRTSYETVSAGTFGTRAREGGSDAG